MIEGNAYCDGWVKKAYDDSTGPGCLNCGCIGPHFCCGKPHVPFDMEKALLEHLDALHRPQKRQSPQALYEEPGDRQHDASDKGDTSGPSGR